MERLYTADFGSIFGARYANAFIYGQIDSLIWPIFSDIGRSDALKNLLELKSKDGHHYFYHRQISLEDEKVELFSSDITYGLVQAMNLQRSYGITNEDVISVVRKEPDLFKAILSFDLSSNVISEIKTIENQIPVVGVVIYPSFIKLDINNPNNQNLNALINYCKDKDYFVKIDIGNMNFQENHPEYTTYNKIKSFLSNNSDIIIILSGLDFSGDFMLYYQLLKLYNNLWIEIEPRCFGGMTPTGCFKQIFSLKGFIQNAWHRITIGSATPTLEIAQMKRGFLEATEVLNFSQKNILRTWAFRNVNRLNLTNFKSEIEPNLFKSIKEINQINRIENDNELIIEYKLKLRSYAITQLLFLTAIIKEIFKRSLEENPDLKSGELFIRSYHTTTSLIINEHEYGNYLDLHYMFAEISSRDSAQFLHTVRALENRADFNHYDHELASTYGSRQLTLPIVDGRLEIGGRENLYILVTFGPRTFNIYIKIKLIKEK